MSAAAWISGTQKDGEAEESRAAPFWNWGKSV